jgi:ABC-2 type transport system permease protein
MNGRAAVNRLQRTIESFHVNRRAVWARAYVRIAGSVREPSWILSETLLPLVGMFAYVLVYRALGAPRAFESFAVLGGLMLAYWLSVLWAMAAQFYWEKQMGNMEFYMIAPCSRIAILTGMALGGIIWTSSRAVVAFALGIWVLKVPFDWSRSWEAVGVFLLALVALYTLGMLMASLFMLYGREAWHLANAFQEPVYLTSGLYFPLKALGSFAFTAFAVLPLSLGLDALRQLLFGEMAQGLLPVSTEVLLLAASVVVFGFLAIRSMRFMEERAKREGRLTLRWQ